MGNNGTLIKGSPLFYWQGKIIFFIHFRPLRHAVI